MRRIRVLALAILLAFSIGSALTACGYSTAGSGEPPAPSLTAEPCPGATIDQSAALLGGETMYASPRVVPVTTLPPGVTFGQVRVVVESGDYSPQSTISAWAGNGLSQCIYAMDHQSECSIVVLERQVNNGWQPQANCHLASPTRNVELPPMQAEFIRLAPVATGAQPASWPIGTYRVTFSYRLDRVGTGQPIEVDSDPFTVA